MRSLIAALAVTLPAMALAAILPGVGAPPDPQQKEIADQFCARNVMCQVVYDDEGHVEKLALSNHLAFWEDKDKGIAPPPAVNDAEFEQITRFSRLNAIFLEKQPLGNASYALLKNHKGLKDVRLHYAEEKDGGKGLPDADFPLFINDLPGLTVLEIKHNFKIKGGCMDRLKPQPELVKLELDTGYATGDAVPFIRAATKLKNLQLHRTAMNDSTCKRCWRHYQTWKFWRYARTISPAKTGLRDGACAD
ncbi:MAG: hypothetical protein OHK0029_13680 [Armatimonadaceae bacterium]